MRIAVSYDYGQISPQFSGEQRFKVYEVENNCVLHQSVVSTIGGVGPTARALNSLGVDTLICGGIRESAKNALTDAGITLCSGISGSADSAVKSYLSGGIHADNQRCGSGNCSSANGKGSGCDSRKGCAGDRSGTSGKDYSGQSSPGGAKNYYGEDEEGGKRRSLGISYKHPNSQTGTHHSGYNNGYVS